MPSQRQDGIQEKDNACPTAAATDRCHVSQLHLFSSMKKYLRRHTYCAGIREEQRDIFQTFMFN